MTPKTVTCFVLYRDTVALLITIFNILITARGGFHKPIHALCQPLTLYARCGQGEALLATNGPQSLFDRPDTHFLASPFLVFSIITANTLEN